MEGKIRWDAMCFRCAPEAPVNGANSNLHIPPQRMIVKYGGLGYNVDTEGRCRLRFGQMRSGEYCRMYAV